MPSNHDKLHIWWWGDAGPAHSMSLSIETIEIKLKPAKISGVVSGRKGKPITDSGWNYAILKFFIEKCSLPQEVYKSLMDNKKQYNYWKNHLKAITEVKSMSAPACNSVVPTPSSTISNMKKNYSLKDLIAELKRTLETGKINKIFVEDAIKKLSDFGYKYDIKRYPEILDAKNFVDVSAETPTNLAEALLWKLGKWQSYKKFTTYFTNDNSEPEQDVVFFAFARHLKDNNNPIYDQHVLRALWVIYSDLDTEEKKLCKSLLFNGNGTWRQTISGNNMISGYKLYTKKIKELELLSVETNLKEIDHLFMPLGQAIKKEAKTYNELCSLCNWPE